MPRRATGRGGVLVRVLTSVGFWGGISVLVALMSLGLPWWGVTNVGPSWGPFFGPPSFQTSVSYFQDRLDAAFAANYSFMTGLILLTAASAAMGAMFRRSLVLATSLILSVITVLAFLWDVGSAVSNECNGFSSSGTCISGLFGQGFSGSDVITWGFQAGFYTFIGSAIILLGTLALQTSKPKERL